MKLNMQFGNGVVSLPEKTLDILHSASALEIKLLILISSERSLRENFSYEEAARALSVSADEISNALKYLYENALVSLDGKAGSEISVRTKRSGDVAVTVVKSGKDLPAYTGAEIEAIFAQNAKLSGLVDECQRVLGKMLTLIEINRIISLCDYYRLDNEYIMAVCKYAVKIGKPSVPYIDKMARDLYEQGITTVTSLEEKLRKLEEISTLEGFVRKLFGLGERKLTSKESKFVEMWAELQYSGDMIELAYEITIDNGKGASMPYMNKILTNWRDAGHTTTEEVINSIEKYRQTKKDTSPLKLSGAGSDSVEEAILSISRSRAQKRIKNNDDNL